MKNTFKITTALSGAVLLVILGFLAKIYLIGEPVDGSQLYCTTSARDTALELRVDTAESAMALRGWKLQRDGNTLSIRARKVLVSPLFSDGTFETVIDLQGIETVLLGGTVIWTDEENL